MTRSVETSSAATSSAEFRAYARECLQWAAEATDEAARQALLDTARCWTHAALRLGGLNFVELSEPPGCIAHAAMHDRSSDAGGR